jgi:hypothetical protein
MKGVSGGTEKGRKGGYRNIEYTFITADLTS